MNFHELLDAVEKWLNKVGNAFQHWMTDASRKEIIYPVLIGTMDGVYFDYQYIGEVFSPLNRIWHNYAVDRVHVDTDWICYSFRVFEPVSVTDRYRLTKRAEQAAKMSLTAWMRERSFYYETDSLVACHFELEHLDVYMARTLNGVSVMEDIRKRTQHWKSV